MEMFAIFVLSLVLMHLIYLTHLVKTMREKAIIREELVDSLFGRVKECETAVLHLSSKFATFRRGSMAAAIQDATDNPDKYLQGSYFIEPGEGK